MSVSEFKENLKDDGVEYDEEAIEDLNENQWVFSYLETELTTFIPGSTTGVPGIIIEYTGYEAEGYILQVEFMDTSGNVYDLGVVSDGFKSTGTFGEGGGIDVEAMMEDLQKILGVFLLVAGLILIVNVCQIVFPVLKGAFTVFAIGIKGIFLILTYPFRLVWRLIFGKK